MTRSAILASLAALALISESQTAQSGSMLELGTKTAKETIVPIGTVPEKKIIPLKLGSLRTDEAKLPPPPLTRSERMMLRAKRAVSRQQEVTKASRQRVAQNRVAQNRDEYDETEDFPVDANGDPVME